jgi:hypothetical protein
MKTLLLIIISLTAINCVGQNLDNKKYIPFVKVKDTVEEAYWYSCGHPNCWDGVTVKYMGLDTLRIYRTYIQINNNEIMIDEKKFYVTKPKGNSEICDPTIILDNN